SSFAARLADLETVCAELTVPVIKLVVDAAVTDPNPTTQEGAGLTAFIAGDPSPEFLKTACNELRGHGYAVIIVVDALEPCAGLDAAIDTLTDDQNLFQVTVAAGVK